MASEREIAKLVITLEAQLKDLKKQMGDAGKGVDGFAKEAEAASKKSESAFKKMGYNANTLINTLKGFIGAQAIIGAFRKGIALLSNTITQSLDAYKRQKDALESLRAAFGYIPPALVEQSRELQKLTGVGDDTINMVQATIGAFIKEEAVVKRVTKAAIDFGKAKRIDVVQAADLLTKSIASGTNALTRYGIQIDGAAGSSERLESAINGVNRAFEGWAETIAATDVGQIEKVRAEIDDIKETIGEKMIPFQLQWNKLLRDALSLITQIFDITVTSQSTIEELEADIVRRQEIIARAEKTGSDTALLRAARQRDKILEIEQMIVEKKKEMEEAEIARKKNQDDAERLEAERLAAARLEKLSKEKKKEQRIIETSLTVIQAQIKQVLSEIEMDYKNAEISTKEYYDSLATMAEFGTKKQIDALKDLLPQLEKLDDTEENRQRIKETNNKIAALEIELQITLAGLADKHADAMAKENAEYAERIRTTEDLLRQIERRVKLESMPEQAREMEELRQRQEDEKNIILENVKDINEQKRYLLEAQALWEREQTELTAKHERETREKTLTTLSDAFGKTSALFDQFYRDRLQIINNTEAAIANAERAGDDGSKERLKAQLKAQQDAARKQFYIAKSLALAEAIINAALAITKVYGQTGIYGALSMIGVAAANGLAIGTIMSQMIAGPGFAEGGMVDGPSGRDVIPARLTKNEFVQPTRAVDYYGTGVMEAIRRRSIPRELLTGYGGGSPRRSSYAFAEGGLATMPPGGERGEMALQINNIVSPALMGDYLTSRDGQSLVLNIISGNAYEIRRRIGI